MNDAENRGGRPRKQFRKTERYTLRLSGGDIALLDFLSAETGKSKAEVLRDGLNSLYREIME